MKGNCCELLDEDRFMGFDDFIEEEGYMYFDMIMEYVKLVGDNSLIYND